MSTKKLSRRDFLRLSAVTASGTVIAAYLPASATVPQAGPKSGPYRRQDAAELVIMYQSTEMTDAEIEAFNAEYAPLTISRLEPDPTRFFASLAAGNAPDMIRTSGADIPQYLARNIMVDLSDYFAGSNVLSLDDLVDANNYYKAKSPTETGEGAIYGMAKDWAPDGFLWINELALEEGGVAAPDPSTPLSLEELAELARAATVKDGDRTLITGLNHHSGFLDRYWMAFAQAMGGNMFSDDFKKVNIVDNEPVVEAIRFFFDLQNDGAMNSPLNPSVDWFGSDLINRQLAIVQTGYWYSGVLRGDEGAQEALAAGKIKMHPAPSIKGTRSNPCITAVGAVLISGDYKENAQMDAAWAAFEWFMGKEPAQNRAAGGWGLPALKSLFELTPQAEGFDAQTYSVVQAEMEFAGNTLAFNPYLAGGEPMTPGQTYQLELEGALNGNLSFDELLELIEEETNYAIEEGIDNIG